MIQPGSRRRFGRPPAPNGMLRDGIAWRCAVTVKKERFLYMLAKKTSKNQMAEEMLKDR